MGYAHRSKAETGEESAPTRPVPSDWYLDPTDPQAASAAALDDAATAFLAAHEAGLLTDAAPHLLTEGMEARGLKPEDLSNVIALRSRSASSQSPSAAPTREGGQVPVQSFEPLGGQSSALSEDAAEGSQEADFAQALWQALAPFAEEDSGAMAWQAEALCAQTDPEAFFPEKGGSTRDAKRVCASCTVSQQCLDYALANDERFGIWGGLSERERRRLRREGR